MNDFLKNNYVFCRIPPCSLNGLSISRRMVLPGIWWPLCPFLLVLATDCREYDSERKAFGPSDSSLDARETSVFSSAIHGFRRLAVFQFLIVVVSSSLAASVTAQDNRPGDHWPGEKWQQADPQQVGMRPQPLAEATQYALSAGGSGMIVRYGKVVQRWGDQSQRYDIKSATKSIGATALGIAIDDGKLKLQDKAASIHPRFGTPPRENETTGWIDRVTLLQLATQTAGFEKPGGYGKLLFEPGTRWHYSDGGPNWLAECVTLAYRRDVQELMFERVFGPIGIGRDDLRWRKHQYRDQLIDQIPRREFGSGVHANVNALARIGYLYLRGGKWDGRQLLSEDYIRIATSPVESVLGLPELGSNHGNASDHYGLLWWNNADGALPDVPRDAYWAWGLYDSLIVVIPSLDLVAVRGGARGRSWPRKEGENHYDVLKPFLNSIVAATQSGQDDIGRQTPYRQSSAIRLVQWAPPETIARGARGSDNWPITWADDDRLYTAYGDGHGFQPRVDRKLSLGLATVAGMPNDFRGVNLRSKIEQFGGGSSGRKASGMLMVGGRLFMLVRNADNAQLAWSDDRGKNWQWADWKFQTSFGCPTFLNFGRNYQGAGDDFVYVYSFDSDSAYQPADRMVMARVPKDRLVDRAAYEFFVGLDTGGRPRWSKNVDDRGAVFHHAGRCYRSAVTYNPYVQRYLWVQIIPDQRGKKIDTRFEGGFGIYDAAHPWGPWTTVYFTEKWDVGPGETASLPTKWMSPDGRTMHLVFSGDDSFSVRRGTFAPAR